MSPRVLVLLVVACGGTVESPAPCAGDAQTPTDANTDTVDAQGKPDTSAPCTLLCDPLEGWVCGGRVIGCFDAGQCCDLQAPGCGCFAGVGYLCAGVPADDATSCAKCGVRCDSSDAALE